jgi:hypothetical protein
MAPPPAGPSSERRNQGRVPFVRRCLLAWPDGRQAQALIVNINTVGAYVAHDDLNPSAAHVEPSPRIGEALVCRFGLPGRADQLEVQALVTWVNARQVHPVHSLPPGFGLTFPRLSPRAQAAIEEVMADASRRAGLEPK